jgi:hypothetical protein
MLAPRTFFDTSVLHSRELALGPALSFFLKGLMLTMVRFILVTTEVPAACSCSREAPSKKTYWVG